METKRELNDILINDDDLQKQNRTKKLMMMIAMALIFLCILIAVVFVITRDEEELSERERANNNGLTPIESQNSFVDVPINNAPEEVDPFQQILDDIRSREQQANTQVAQNTQPTTPSVPKEPTKPAQQPASTPKVTTPSKPATQPAQTSNIANIFEDVSTPRMDTSKNGQVAEKGFYVQVGSFANKPSAEFLKQINNYSYRVYAGTSNGQPTTKYLIGPYNSRTEASRDLPNFKTIVPNPVHFEVK